MGIRNNVILLKPAGGAAYEIRMEEHPKNTISVLEETTLIEKATKVLDELEDAWETDHGTVEVRDHLHLLRHYLNRLRERQ
jgi:hypothetical protein